MPLSLAQFQHDYDTELFTMKIDDRQLRFFKPKSIDRFLNADNLMDGFPLWAKIWEAATVLTNHMLQLPVAPEHRILELGAGLGVTAIAAAAKGHCITATEYNADALNYINANARLNACDNIFIARLDWHQPDMDDRFDLIIGSEIAYKESNIRALVPLFKRYLAPGGTILIAESVRSTGAFFWEQMAPWYDITAHKHTLRSGTGSHIIILFELHPKP
jgi:predicted nicotinamide N-methyase